MDRNRLKSQDEQVRIMRRVLRLVDGYLSQMDQAAKRTYGRGTMTISQLRQHVRAALRMKPKEVDDPPTPPRNEG